MGCGTRLIVLDTHVWLWWAGAVPGLSRAARTAIDSADRIGVCTISCFEVATLARRGRIELDRKPWDWISYALALDRVNAIPLDPGAAAAAGALGERFPGDPADRIIVATARALGARLVTKDRRLRDLDRSLTLW